MLNLQIHLLWASSQQHESGIKQNKLSESILPLATLGWVTTFVFTSVCLCRVYIFTHTPGYAGMSLWIKSVFSRHIWIHACACLWTKSGFPDLPFQGSHKLAVCTDSVICSVTKGGSSLLILCVLVCCVIFFKEIFFSHFHKKHTISVCAFLYDTDWLSLKEEESVWLPSFAICIK